jgi:DNA-binding NarL/FixJ family response regulator
VTIRVALADDHALVRAGFRVLIDSEPDLEVVGEAADGAAAVELARRTKPDVILMDIRMPGTDGVEATKQITADAEGATDGEADGQVTKVLVLTTFDLDEYVYGALRSGASGFLLKDTPPGELLNAIRLIADGHALLAPSVTRQLISEFARLTPTPLASPEVLDMLTDREKEVLALVAQGLSNVEITERLTVSLPTAKTHVSRLLTKLGARDRAQLVMIAYESGFVGRQGAEGP